MIKLSCTIVLISFLCHAKLLDKIATVVGDQVHTLSDLKEIKKSISSRKEIAPFVYTKTKYDLKAISYHLRNAYIIKDKLEEQGIVVSDERVEEQIERTKKNLGINQSILEENLRQRGLKFDEYFNLTKEIMEYNFFNRNIIAPLVVITDQELKNFYYQQSNNKSTLSFNYNLTNYILPSNKEIKKILPLIPSMLEKYKETNILPGALKDLSNSDMGDISSEDLPKNIDMVLRDTSAENFSKAIIIDNQVNIFFLKKKDLIESDSFKKAKEQIYSQIYFKRSKEITQSWFSREALNYFFLSNL